MDQFFRAVFVLSTIFLVLLMYYAIKNIRRGIQKRRTETLVFDKFYEDEKSYVRSKLKSLLIDLETGRIQWILISSRLFPQDRVQLTYSQSDREIHLVEHSRKLNEDEKEQIKRLGVQKYLIRYGDQLFTMPLNSKIITDLIYFLFENIYNHRRAHNIKMTISGE